MRAFEQKLVRHARRNTDNVSGGNFLAYPALDRSVALFMRPYSLSIHQGAADYQGRRAGLHEEDVRLSLVPLRLTVGLSVNQHGAVVGKICQQLHRKMMRIGGGVACIF